MVPGNRRVAEITITARSGKKSSSAQCSQPIIGRVLFVRKIDELRHDRGEAAGPVRPARAESAAKQNAIYAATSDWQNLHCARAGLTPRHCDRRAQQWPRLRGVSEYQADSACRKMTSLDSKIKRRKTGKSGARCRLKQHPRLVVIGFERFLFDENFTLEVEAFDSLRSGDEVGGRARFLRSLPTLEAAHH